MTARAIIDSSTFVGRFLRAPGLDLAGVDDVLADGVVMTAPNWSESMTAFYRRRRWHAERSEGRFSAKRIIGDIVTLVPFDRRAARITADAHRELMEAGLLSESPGFCDVACLALARELRLMAVTSDSRWRSFAPVLGVTLRYFPIGRA